VSKEGSARFLDRRDDLRDGNALERLHDRRLLVHRRLDDLNLGLELQVIRCRRERDGDGLREGRQMTQITQLLARG